MAFSTSYRIYRWIAGGWLVLILLLSFLPTQWKEALHTKGELHDTGHLLVFGALAFLLARSGRTRDQSITLLFFAAVLGVGIEFAQDLRLALPQGSWSPVEWRDIVVDTMAVLIAGVIELGFGRRFERGRVKGLDRS